MYPFSVVWLNISQTSVKFSSPMVMAESKVVLVFYSLSPPTHFVRNPSQTGVPYSSSDSTVTQSCAPKVSQLTSDSKDVAKNKCLHFRLKSTATQLVNPITTSSVCRKMSGTTFDFGIYIFVSFSSDLLFT